MDIKTIITTNKRRNDPNSTIAEAVKEIRIQEAIQKIEKNFQIFMDGLEKRIVSDVQTKVDKILEGVKNGEDSKAEDVAAVLVADPKFMASIAGEDGDEWSKEQILALVKPLIPSVQNGETPSDAKLLKLIKRVMPKVRDGETPSDSRLRILIKQVMPKISKTILDTPQQIAKKLNTTEQSVNQSVIKGLERSLATLQRSIKVSKTNAGGGGMGNVQHENTATSSATTSVTTNSRIAAGGNALWVYYNGQLLMKGVHYTVGTDQKTITLLITLQDSTNISIVYIRT